MRTSNPVFQILPTFGNQALLAKDLRIDTPTTGLKHGQLGAFNAHTGLSVDATSAIEDMRDIYFAVGINRTTPVATALAEDIITSAGQMIQTRRSRATLVKPAVNEVQKVVELSGFTALCSSPYAIKIEFRNQMSYLQNGYNQFSKTFNYWTSCCPQTDCGDCPSAGSAAEVAVGLAADINSDPDKLVIATANTMGAAVTLTGTPTAANSTVVAGTTTYTVPLTAGTPTTAASQIAAYINAQSSSPYTATSSGAVLNVYPKNASSTDTSTVTVSGAGVSGTATMAKGAMPTPTPAGAGGILTITGVAQPRPPFNNGVPIKYYKQGTDFIVSMVEGVGLCNGVVTTITNLQYPEGQGYDLQAQEYVAGGWNGKPGPYRTLTLNGGFSKSFEMLVNSATVYNQTVLEYEMESIGGADEYFSDLKTIIAIPNTDTATSTALGAFLTAVYTGKFPSLVNDYAKAGLVAANTPVRDGVKTYADDGIDYAL